MITKELDSSLRRTRIDEWGQPSIVFYDIQVMPDGSMQGITLGNYVYSGSEEISEEPSFISEELETEYRGLEQAGLEALSLYEQAE